jgi:hypothetical protein
LEKPKKQVQDEKDELDDSSLVEQANKHYADILNAMKEQDWTAMGVGFDKLGLVLEQMS